MNYKKRGEAFFNSFRSNHVLLYVGKNASNDELAQWIAKCPWSCVITSRTDPELANLFIVDGDRQVYNLTSRAAIPRKPLNRKKLPVIRLFGVDGEAQDDEDLAWLEEGSQNQGSIPGMDNASEILRLVPEFMDHVNPLVIIGADSDVDWQVFSAGKLTSLLYQKATDGTVTIWDMPEESTNGAFTSLKKAANLKGFGFYNCSLSQIIQSRDAEDAFYAQEESALIEDDRDVYYQGKNAVNITQNDLLLFKDVGTLLTERTISRIQPLGREQSRLWFSNFLQADSNKGPQWYGYLPRSTFYVKRSYEDALVQLVRKMLEGRGPDGAPSVNRPIVLCGDPGSSKSISLGALAYRIYNERINPVIYTVRDSLSWDSLDEAVRLLEQKAAADTRILIIWDNSSYRAEIDNVKQLMENLQNRGRRRFILVCSSYNLFVGNSEDTTSYFYSPRTGKYEQKADEIESCTQVFDRYGCYFVKATRFMTQKEQTEFWSRAREYSGINPTAIKQLRERMIQENRTEIFDYYYSLLTLLRQHLEDSLHSEQNRVTPYVEHELAYVLGQIYHRKHERKEQSAMYQALLKAGLDPALYLTDESLEPQEDAATKECNLRLDKFNICVALFSRFKLTVPYGLVYSILVGKEGAGQYSKEGLELFKLVTTSIPWIYYGEDEKGEFSFRFRNSLEADIYLHTHDITGEQQVKLLGEIIDIYGADYRRSRCKDQVFTESLQSLLRLMGPNTSFTPFLQNDCKGEHLDIQKRLNEIISKLENLKDVDGVPDEDAGFAAIIVTFTREYYGQYWKKFYGSEDPTKPDWECNSGHFNKETYELRIGKLVYAIALAERNIEDIEHELLAQEFGYLGRQHLINQRYSMVIETAQCSLRLDALTKEYLRYCTASGENADEALLKRKISYRLLYNQIRPMIDDYPTNGYPYNTIFKLFENMYEQEKLTDTQKLQYLTEIMQVVEICKTYNSDISNRGSGGNDELSKHLATITAISESIPITLSSIIQYRKNPDTIIKNSGECAFLELFDEMLEANNPAAITFICQKEIRVPRSREYLNTDELLRCRAVYNFMCEKQIFECVCAKEYSLSMLIRVFWMMCNKTPLTTSRECQLTRLSDVDWQKLYQLCAIYLNVAGENAKPIITLLYALCTLNVNHFDEQGYMTAQETLRSIPEQLFGQNRQRRMWTPFMICNSDGEPIEYTGTVINLAEKNGGFIRVNGIPQHLGHNNGVRFHLYNLGRNTQMPSKDQALKNLEIGIGYMGFSAYTSSGRHERGGKE